jgi:DNA invertase Pin-like site-specific DNA recombinase
MMLAVSYIRISKNRKDKATYSVPSQRTANKIFESRGFRIVKEFVEYYSGGKNDRKVLMKALDYCRRFRATLLIATLDRLGRRVLLIATLLDSNIHFRLAQYPDINPKENRLFILSLAIAAEAELLNIRRRTKDGLAEASRSGVVLGKNAKELAKKNKQAADDFALKMQPIIQSLQEIGITSVRGIRKALTKRRVKTFQGKSWHNNTVHLVLRRIEKLNSPNLSSTVQV